MGKPSPEVGAFDFSNQGRYKAGPRRQHAGTGQTKWTWTCFDRLRENDFVTDEEFDRLLDAWFGNIARVLEPGRGFYIWGGYANCANYPPFLKKHGLYFSQAIIWDKEHPVLTRKDMMGSRVKRVRFVWVRGKVEGR